MEQKHENLYTSNRKLTSKERLLKVAIENFAERGFEGASIRDITTQAHVNISAISYYFKDKEGLYNAALNFISKKMKNEFLPYTANATQLLENDTLSPEAIREVIHTSLRQSIGFLINDESSYYIYKIFMQEHISPSASFDDFFKEVIAPLNENLSKIVARVLKISYPSEEATLYAHIVAGMISIFRTHKTSTLRRLGWEKYGPKEIEKITEMVIRNIDSIIDCYDKYRK